jgi:hypothetical protein
MAIDKIMSKKVFLQDDDKVPGAYVNTTRRFPPSFSHKNDTFNLTQYIKNIVATVLTGVSATFVSITALSANIGKNLFGYGTTTLPSITFNGDDNTGIYHHLITADKFGFTAGGVSKATVSSTGLKLTKGAVTQITTISTGVSIATSAGKITTVASTLAADASATFTVTNSSVEAGDIVIASLYDYNGTTGTPIVKVDNTGTGTFDVTITNVAAADPLNGTLEIAFVVL